MKSGCFKTKIEFIILKHRRFDISLDKINKIFLKCLRHDITWKN